LQKQVDDILENCDKSQLIKELGTVGSLPHRQFRKLGR